MNEEFSQVLIEALTQALERGLPVTIKNSINNSIIALTATDDKIVMSLSKMPNIFDDLIHILSDVLGAGPDLIYNRVSVIKEDFIIFYAVWIRHKEESRDFVEQEFSMAQNHITFMSPKAISIIKDANLNLENN